MPSIEHVFVLMLENRSFDHLFGFSGLTGIDAATGTRTSVDGLTGEETNSYQGKVYAVQRGADYTMPADPGHEFPNVLDQLCGPIPRYVPPYPPIDGSGFVDSYAHTGGSADPCEIMKCFDTARQLPVLYALAQEYAICDRWFSSLPGPTWPNRMFVHGASSAGLDHSPSTAEIIEWETVSGFSFPRGSIFDALKRKGVKFSLYSGDDFPMVAALKGLGLGDVHRIDALLADLKKSPFPYSYALIEPSYNILNDYRGSSSMHPLADVRDGEALVKTVYEALRASPAWERSLLVIMWDEHGGFFDHVPPPPATPPGDTAPGSKYNQYRFTFAQYGVRTPAIIVSPLIPKGSIDHRVYDHASVPATLEALFGLPPLTARDAQARSLLGLLTLPSPRLSPDSAVPVLPAPIARPALAAAAAPLSMVDGVPVSVARGDDPLVGGMLPSLVHSALRQDLLVDPGSKATTLATVAGLSTRAEALSYIDSVQKKLLAASGKGGGA